MNSVERQFREKVLSYLKSIDKTKVTPKVARLLQSKEGYSEAEEQILDIMLKYDMTIPQAINELESRL